jgi:hypothetical protein
MALKVKKYDVQYPNGLKRRKQLSEEDAKLLSQQGAKVTDASGPQPKQARPAENKSASAGADK